MTALITNPPAVRTAPRFLPVLLVLFIGSGCAALIYEIVWLQLLSLIIGSTAISLGVLLGTFMGGMCLGSILLPRVIKASKHPLRVYAMLELLIGIIGVIVLQGIPLVADAYTAYSGSGVMGVMMRAMVAGICLLPPTLLMGATLPAIARWVETSSEGVSWLGFFYGGNIAGAVFGCLLAGFYLLRVFDMATATYVALCVNLTVAAIALLLSSLTPHESETSRNRNATPLDPLPVIFERSAADWAVYITIGLSGLTGLAAEVIWTRLLSLMLGMTVYTFSIILAVFLVGLGIGSSVAAMWAKTVKNPRMALGICQFMLALSTAWAAYSIAYSLPYWPISPALTDTSKDWPWYMLQIDMVRCFWVVLPGALFWGASFPLALAAVAKPGQDAGRLVGGVYAANTVGAILGSLIFSMLIIPNFGTLTSERLLIAICALSAAVMLVPVCAGLWIDHQPDTDERPLFPVIFGSITVIAALIGICVIISEFSSPDRVTATYHSYAAVPWQTVAFGRFEADSSATDIPVRQSLYVGEGMNVSVAVTQDGPYRFFHGAGKVQASSNPNDMHLQRMLGHLSALLAKKHEDVLVVACGAGVTAGSFVPYPDVKHITICDIEKLVPENVAHHFFADVNYDVVHDPRTKVVCDDGRHFVRTTKQKFDIITSDPIDPWVKGCASLNTIEYYTMCKQHLNPGGVMSLWIPLYENKLQSAQCLITTFFQVYPHGIIFSNDETKGEGYDAVLLGSADDHPDPINIDAIQKKLDTPEYAKVKQSLRDVNFGNDSSDPTIDLLATFAGQAPDLKDWMDEAIKRGDINTDTNLRLQFLAGMWLNSYVASDILHSMLKYYRFPREIFTGSDANMQLLEKTLADDGRTRFNYMTPQQ